MDEMTQHNAALVEETNAAIDQTESQAAELDQIIDEFATAESIKSATRELEARMRVRERAAEKPVNGDGTRLATSACGCSGG